MKNLADKVKDDKELLAYLPDKLNSKKKLEREWVMNVINTVHPGFL